jgi:hypothetical protein
MTTGPAPGFYADTTTPGQERYWDGERWTDHFRAAMPQPTFAAPVTPTPAQSETAGGIVVTGYVFAVIFPLVGFILGIVAVTRPAKTTSRHGVWIIVVSVVAFIFWLAVLAGSSSGSTY